MLISAIQRFTMLDFPGRTSCIVFIPGCNMRCRFCHNPEFVLPEMIQKIKKSFISEESFFNFLNKRKGLLDGVTISGGEPTIMPDLPKFIQQVRDMGFQVKLDSNGNNPRMLKKLFNSKLIDYIAMDVKTDLENYPDLVRGSAKTENITKSIDLIMNSGVDYEFRTTLIREVHTPRTLKNMAEMMNGAKAYYLQAFRQGETIDPAYNKYHPFSEKEMRDMINNIFLPKVKKAEIRLA